MKMIKVFTVIILSGLSGCTTCNPACWSFSDASIVVHDKFGFFFPIENGTAYDKVIIELGEAKKIVLPNNAVICRGGEPGKMKLFLAKKLSFYGHIPFSMTICGARKNMGCAVQTEGDFMKLATYGEWDSRIEGGAFLYIAAEVPADVQIEQRKGLSGWESLGHSQDKEEGFFGPKGAKCGYWYGSVFPAQGWTAIPSVPDPNQTARNYFPLYQ